MKIELTEYDGSTNSWTIIKTLTKDTLQDVAQFCHNTEKKYGFNKGRYNITIDGFGEVWFEKLFNSM